MGIAEVKISMFGPAFPTAMGCLTRDATRKMHSSYPEHVPRDGDIPLAMVSRDSFTHINKEYAKRGLAPGR